ncbi:MAG: acyltransferase, partial [Chitinophagaceae bacterium]|nr:acyltransferase [Chitinophagaceae bacterium]
SGIYIRHILPGLFKSAQHFDHGVNGSLWSISLEIKLYLTLIIAGLLYKRGIKNIFIILVILTLIFTFLVNCNFENWQNYFDALHTKLFLVFIIGNLCFLYYKMIPLNILLLLTACLAWVLTLYFCEPLVVVTEPVLFAYLTLFCCYTKKTIALKTDISYGIYIYAFLITQILIELAGKISPVKLTALVVLCTIPVSYLSWILIEKRALAQKKNYDHLFGKKEKISGI